MLLGIEIGGTKLQLGVGDGSSAKLAELQRRDIVPEQGAAGILRQIEQLGRFLLQRHTIDRIGIGFGGPVQAGVVTRSHQIHGWDNFPLGAWCEECLGRPTVVGNDCDVAALAEARLAAGRGGRTVFYVTVGTGVGGGLVIDGRLHGAGRPAVAEIGHLRPGPSARAPGETVESLASGWGIASSFRRLTAVGKGTDDERAALRQRWGEQLDGLTAKDVAQLAAQGQGPAQAALQQALETLGWAIAQVVTLLAPDVVVVGGGVSLLGEQQFFAPLRAEVERYVFPPLRGSYRLVPAGLGELAVVCGALVLARDASP